VTLGSSSAAVGNLGTVSAESWIIGNFQRWFFRSGGGAAFPVGTASSYNPAIINDAAAVIHREGRTDYTGTVAPINYDFVVKTSMVDLRNWWWEKCNIALQYNQTSQPAGEIGLVLIPGHPGLRDTQVPNGSPA